MAHLIIHNIAS